MQMLYSILIWNKICFVRNIIINEKSHYINNLQKSPWKEVGILSLYGYYGFKLDITYKCYGLKLEKMKMGRITSRN